VIVDTSVVVAAERTAISLAEVLEDDDQPAIAAITVAELLVGVELARGARRRRRAEQLDALLAAVPVEPYTGEIARVHAHLMATTRATGRPQGGFGLIIAATAVATARTVIGADRAAFADLPGVSARILG
jgi:tRNA(fMet)-specific endonuclease VapC